LAKVSGYTDFPTIKIALLLYSLLSCFALLVGAANYPLIARGMEHQWSIIGARHGSGPRNLIALAVIALVGAIQSALLVLIFVPAAKLPAAGNFLPPIAEIWLPTFITSYTASALGIFITSLSSGKRSALAAGLAVFLVQVMFTGVMFSIKSPILSALSYASVCRWSLVSYGATADFVKIATDEGLEKTTGAIGNAYAFISPLDKKIGGGIKWLKDKVMNSENTRSTARETIEGLAKRTLEKRGLITGPPKHSIARAWAILAFFALCLSISAFVAMASKRETADDR